MSNFRGFEWLILLAIVAIVAAAVYGVFRLVLRLSRPPVPVPLVPGAGWFADPQSPGALRYWDGSAWTQDRAQRPTA